MICNRSSLSTPPATAHVLSLVLNHLPDAVLAVDAELRVVFANAAATSLFALDFSALSLLQQEIDIRFPTGLPCTVAKLLQKQLLLDDSGSIEILLPRADADIPLRMTVRALDSAADAPATWLLIFADIRWQKSAEAILLQNNEHLEESQRLGHVGSWSWDAASDRVYWSREHYRLFGLNSQLLAPSFIEQRHLYTFESFIRLHAALNATLHTGQFCQIDLHALHADGSIRNVCVRIQAKHDRHDKISGLTGTVMDVSERHRINEQFKLIIDMVPLPIFVKDTASRFLIINKACEELFGAQGKDLLGTDGSQFFPPEQMAIFLSKDREVWDSRTLVENEEYVWSTKYHSSRRCITLKKPIYDEFGQPRYIIATLEDITERKQTEDSLRETLANLRAIYDNLPFLVWMKDCDGYYQHVNKHWLKAVGLSAEVPLATLTDQDIWPPNLAQHYRAIDLEVMQTRGQIVLTEQAITAGRETWTETIKAPVVDNQNQVIGAIGIARDITESFLAKEQLRHYSQRLCLATKAASIGICEWDMQTARAEWDERMYAIFGIPQGEPIDFLRWKKAVLPDDVAHSKQTIVQQLRDKQEAHWEFRIHRQSDGQLRYIQAASIVSCDAQGQVQKIIGVNLDITDFRLIETALRESEAHLEQAQAQAHLGSWTLDIQTGTLRWSNEGYRIFGVAQGAAVTFDDFMYSVHLDDRVFVAQAWQAALTGEPYDIQHRIVVEGKVKWLRERAEVSFAADGTPLFALGTCQDITELQHIAENLERSRLQLRQLAASRENSKEEERKRIAREVHDELGQMLTVLRMEISILRINFAGGNERLTLKINAILALIDKTLEVTRNIATALRPTAIEMGILPAMEWLVSNFAEHSGKECRLICNDPNLSMDEECAITLFRIAQESLTNVLKHAEASQVKVTLDAGNEYYLLEVYDNGKGFNTAELRQPNSFGIMGIKERALMLGGDASISVIPGTGTYVQVIIPVDKLRRLL